MTIRQVIDGQSGLPVPNSTHSYWHKDPSKVLFGHRTTSELPEKADIVIVGTGITGSFAAHFLKNGKAKDEHVVMLEAREACWGATGRNGGHCQPLVYARPPAVAAFELETFHFLKQFVADNKVPCDWVSFAGCHAFLTQDLFDLASEMVEKLGKSYPDLASQIKIVRPGDGLGGSGDSLESLRIPDAKGAILQANAASLWPYKLVSWVLEQLLAKFGADGFNLQTNTPVTKLTNDPGSSHPWILSTPRGQIAAKKVLLATNGYTSRLLPAFTDLIVPTRGQIGAMIPPGSSAAEATSSSSAKSGGPAKLEHSYIFLASRDQPLPMRDDYLIQRPVPGGELIFGGGRFKGEHYAVGEWRDDVIEEAVATYLRSELSPPLDLNPPGEEKKKKQAGTDAAATTTTTITGLPASFEWTGIMGYSRDGVAWVGAVPPALGGGDGLYIAAGYTGHGMPVAALAARSGGGTMVGADDEDDDAADAVAAAAGGLPAAFRVSEERVAAARAGPTVAEYDMMGSDALAVEFKALVEHLSRAETA